MAKRRTKRENGTGAVYKRNDTKHRPWVAVTPTRYEINPETEKLVAVRDIIGHFPSAKEAKESLEAFRANPTTKLNITLSGYAA